MRTHAWLPWLLAGGIAGAQEPAPVEMKPDAETQAAAAAAPGAARLRPALMAPLAASTTLLGIAAAGQTLVAVGQRGHILLSADGTAWQQVDVPVNAMLNRVRFRDAQQGWAIGHDATILATADGGRTWQLRHHDVEGKALYDLLVLDEQRLVAVGAYGTYLVSADGGASWEPRANPLADLGQHFNALVRLADGTLLVAGERGLLARSVDDGERWELLDSPYTGSFFGALPVGDKGALVFGLRGNLYTTPDVSAAKTLEFAAYDPFTRETTPDDQALARTGWTPIPRPTTESLFGGAVDGTRALLVGVNGVVVSVDASGRTAARMQSGAPETLNDLVRHGSRWLAVGRRGVQDLGALDLVAGEH